MIITRKPPYPLTATYTVDGPDTYVVVIEDLKDNVLSEQVIEVASGNSLTFTLPNDLSKYDETYALSIYILDSYDPETSEPVYSDYDVVVEDNLTVERTYIDPATLGTTASEIAQYAQYEQLARAIIDAHTGGFYLQAKYVEEVGQGTDYFPLWNRTYKILKAYENSELVYDSSQTPAALGDWNYLITKDKTAITKDPVTELGGFNRSEQKPPVFPLAASDSISLYETDDSGNVFTIQPGTLFPSGVDYIFKLEQGYKVVPVDIQDATLMLIEDIKCGKLDYYKRYVTSYSTDQFRLQFDKSMLNGTGNILVDKIIDKYITDYKRPGVL